ncbi:MAG: hypothetical protein K8R91_05535 [Phycisphaerae bacterium]|nr:hypothetical protein [Phycisphaerae bacterium]
MRYIAVIMATGLAFTLLTAVAEPVSKPGIVPTSWELEFEYQTPQPITIQMPGWKEKQTFWYMLYTITNRSGADRIFVPGFSLYTDSGQVSRSGERIPPAVFLAIKKRHNNPLLVDMAFITGTLLQGADNAKDGVAIWSDFDHKARGFDVFVAGVSGERAKIKLPKPIVETVKDKDGKEEKVTKTEVTLSKTLYLRYALPGEAAARSAATPKFLEKQWVMR